MNTNQTGDKAKMLLLVEFDPALRRILDSGDLLHKEVQSTLVRDVTDLMEVLGIPGIASVEIRAAKENSLYDGRFLRLSVNGQLCRYPDELLQRVYSYVNSTLLDPQAKPGNILVWLNVLAQDQSAGADLNREKAVEYLSLTCVEIIKRRPNVLLGLEQVREYRASLFVLSPQITAQAEILSPTRLLPILQAVLALKISLADKQRVAKILESTLSRTQEDISEELIAALRPDSIEIQLSLDYLKQITIIDQERGPRLFTDLRKYIFDDFLTYPPFRFVPVEGLKPHSFAFKINHVATLPWIGLLSNQYLVNETVDKLEALNIESTAVAVANQLVGWEARLVDLGAQDPALYANLSTFNQLFYLILCFDSNLRENAASFLYLQFVQDQLEQLGSQSRYPALIKALQPEVPPARVVCVLRALVAEEIPIRNLRLILESLLKYNDDGAIARGQAREGVDTARQEQDMSPRDFSNLISFVRTALHRQIRKKFSGETTTLSAHFLATDMQQFLVEHQVRKAEGDSRAVLDEDESDKIIRAVRTTFGSLPSLTPIITTLEIRALLRETIAPEFRHHAESCVPVELSQKGDFRRYYRHRMCLSHSSTKTRRKLCLSRRNVPHRLLKRQRWSHQTTRCQMRKNFATICET